MNIVILGCGAIGIGSAHLLQQQGHHVVGARRNTSALPTWLQSRYADVTERESLAFLRDIDIDVLIYAVAASGFDEAAYQRAYVDGIGHVIAVLQQRPSRVPALLFVSSTAVYHQNDGSIVDENSPTRPERFNGRLMLAAEQQLATSDDRIAARSTAVRFSGIYGPGRLRMINRVRTDGISAADEHLTNRIHADDCAAVLAHLAMLSQQQNLPPVYLASDCQPATRHAVEKFIAEELVATGTAVPGVSDAAGRFATTTGESTTVADTDPVSAASSRSGLKQPKSQQQKRIAGDKFCSNQLLLDSGYRFIYPTYQEGYRALLRDKP